MKIIFYDRYYIAVAVFDYEGCVVWNVVGCYEWVVN